MPTFTAVLSEVRLGPGGLSGALDVPPALRPAPGQYLLASSGDPTDPLPAALFPATPPDAPLRVAPPLPAHWSGGMRLHLRGPLGHGFHLPEPARRVALAALDSAPELLLPLAHLALRSGAAVALYAAQPPQGLPDAVEALPLELLAEALSWADYLAAAFPLSSLPALRRLCALAPHQQFSMETQGLVLATMPCGGAALCGACAVLTGRGWKHACADGPVFSLNLLEEAG